MLAIPYNLVDETRRVGAPERFVAREARQLTISTFDAPDRTVDVGYLWAGASADHPTIVVLGGISADRDVWAPDGSGWWQDIVGCRRAVDLDKCCVLSIDWLTAADLGSTTVTTDDQADVIAALLDALGVDRVAAFIGSSYGGMVGLSFAARHHDRLDQLIVLAAAHRPHPIATAQRSVQRGILRWGLDTGQNDRAVSLARQLAMTTYRGADEFQERFAGASELMDGRLCRPVEAYLEHAGAKFVDRFDAHRYLSLSESIDLHEVDPRDVRVPTTLLGFPSDRLVPLSDLEALRNELAGPAGLHVVPSLYGHDGFLKETPSIAPIVRRALKLEGVSQ